MTLPQTSVLIFIPVIIKTMTQLNKWLSIGLVMFKGAACFAQKPELVVQTGHHEMVLSLAFSPDGKLPASGSFDTTVKLWDVATGLLLRTHNGRAGSVDAVAFSPDGKTLARERQIANRKIAP